MKLIDAIKHKGNPYWIPDSSHDDLPEFFKQLGFKTGAEIGVCYGDNLKKYCEAGLKMFGIDPWEEYGQSKYLQNQASPDFSNRPAKTMKDIYKIAIENLAPYQNCTIIRKKSMDALTDIPDRSLDFVYIDGSHEFGDVAMDLTKWSEKVKKGGIIAGDDYYSLKGNRVTRMVGFVVDAFMKGYDINNWYILGRKKPKSGEKNDGHLNFMFFKHW